MLSRRPVRVFCGQSDRPGCPRQSHQIYLAAHELFGVLRVPDLAGADDPTWLEPLAVQLLPDAGG